MKGDKLRILGYAVAMIGLLATEAANLIANKRQDRLITERVAEEIAKLKK